MKERSYSVLIVSSSDIINQAIKEILSSPLYSVVNTVSSISAADRALEERDFDFVIINAPVVEDTGFKFAIETADSSPSVILYMAKTELYTFTYDALVSHGVFMIQKPLSKSAFQTVSSWMMSARERMRKTEKKELSFEEKMQEIRIVNHAKWILISELKMTENEAHKYIEKQAMDRCVSKTSVAEEIIRTYS